MTEDGIDSGSRERMEAVRHAIDSGAAVCLLGAGFSAGGTDASGNTIPTAPQLMAELKKLFEIPESEQLSLSEVADFAQESAELRLKLIQHLVSRLTSCQPSQDQCDPISKNWRAVFTTNFDDLPEQCGVQNRTNLPFRAFA